MLSSLTLKSDFAKMRSEGKKVSFALFTVVYLQNSQVSGLRIAFALSRKVANAVKRNRIRRRIREALRLEDLSNLNYDILFLPRKSLYNADWDNVRGDIRGLFSFLMSKNK